MRRHPPSPLGTKPRGELQKGDTPECRETRCKSKSFCQLVGVVGCIDDCVLCCIYGCVPDAGYIHGVVD
jgi:hypothetical protein